MIVAVSVAANISGGHVNPAVTFGAFIGGNITLLRAILYWIAQLLGSVVACILLKFATGGMVSKFGCPDRLHYVSDTTGPLCCSVHASLH